MHGWRLQLADPCVHRGGAAFDDPLQIFGNVAVGFRIINLLLFARIMRVLLPTALRAFAMLPPYIPGCAYAYGLFERGVLSLR